MRNPIRLPADLSTLPPLAQVLLDVFKTRRDGLVRANLSRLMPARVDVIDRKLCDDAIQYLAPSLKPYRGCTIIDIHPGPCQWSASLHDYLRPRRHLLMEPDEEYRKTFIQPLLDQPGSTYRHTTLSGAHPKSYWQNYRTVLDDPTLLDPRPAPKPGDPQLRQLDTTFLVTGNLVRWYKSFRSSKAAPFVQLVLQHLTWAGLNNGLFHQSGLVKMLFWTPEILTPAILPPSLMARSGYNMGLSVGATLNQVVGVQANYDNYVESYSRTFERDPGILAATNLAVDERMAEDGCEVPDGRSLLRSGPNDKSDLAFKSPLDIPEDESAEEFEQAVRTFEARVDACLKVLNEWESGPKMRPQRRRLREELYANIEYPQCARVRGHPETVSWWRHVNEHDLHCRLINLEARYCAVEEKGGDVTHLKARLFAADERIRAVQHEYHSKDVAATDWRLEDMLGFCANTLSWDRRRFEPFGTDIASFWPPYPLSLIEVTPIADRDLNVSSLGEQGDAVATYQSLIKYLMQKRAGVLSEVLDQIAPNAAKDLIPMIPGVTDPRKGGRLNPERFKVRMMTEDMIVGLFQAWYEWPFRPPKWELESATFNWGNSEDEKDLVPDTATGIASR